MKKNKKKKEKVHSEFYITCKENITEFLKDKRTIMILSIFAIMVVLIILVIFIFSVAVVSREKMLTKSLSNMASDYYENFYFEQVGVSTGVSREEFLANFATIGIKINLENLEVFQDGKYKKEIEKFMKPKSSKCDKFNTKAIVYQKRPYSKKDYDLEINLECKSSK